jgi:large conductance mechanosensitive channel
MVDVIMDIIGKAGGTPDFSEYEPGGVSVGAFLTALISFLILAAVVYFLIVTPYTKAKMRMDRNKEEVTEAAPDDVRLLTEIRDLLASRTGPTL